ncbi:MAG: ATP-binding cassette domain-containing protein [Anaerolineales bacterium]|nr:ATP-binding cassette domain-containing protein [Anaerolineales bacterium]
MFKNVDFIYPETSTAVLSKVTLHIPEGSFTLVAGRSGSGKSTLLRCINGLVPHFTGGTIKGKIRVAGLDPVIVGPQMMSKRVGFVFQDPENQFVLDNVEDEVAFALENAAFSQNEMHSRVNEVLDLLGISHLRDRDLSTLSGGECQKVAIAASLALRPKILVLDEPTSQLDPQSAREVLDAVYRLNRELGLTIVIAEHRLERVLAYADTFVYMSKDVRGLIHGNPQDVLSGIEAVPPVVSLGKRLGWKPIPLSIEDASPFVSSLLPNISEEFSTLIQNSALKGPPLVSARGLKVAYNGRQVLHGLDFNLWRGEIACLVGPNGAGKTTLLKTIVGLMHPQSGEVYLNGERITSTSVVEICGSIGYLPQDPNTLLFAESVHEELITTLRNHKYIAQWGEDRVERTISELLKRLGLRGKGDLYPRDLSVGERQRVALGAITVTLPDVLLLDEPTRGLDYHAKQALGDLLRGWKEEGLAILLVTHDVELVASLADRLIYLQDGEIVADGLPASVFPVMSGFIPQMLRLFPNSGLLSVDDVCTAIERLKKNIPSPICMGN